MPFVSLRDVTKTYPAAERRADVVTAVDHVSFDVDAGSITAIIGYSGAGKSTLVRLVNGLERTTSGTIEVDGTSITGLGERTLRTVRRDIGMIFQQFNLLESRDVSENIAYPLRVAGVPRDERERRVRELLDFVGLADRARNFPEQLSGGQKQRVGIARALATSPKLLLADEATSALDPETTQDVLALLRRVNREFGITILIITHEMEVVRALADHVVVMEHGRAVEQGDTYRVFSQPSSDVTRRFLATVLRRIPGGEEWEQLRERHPGRLVSVRVLDGSDAQTRLEREAAQAAVGLELVFGGVQRVTGRGYGYLLYELHGDAAAVDALVGAVSSVDIEEVGR